MHLPLLSRRERGLLFTFLSFLGIAIACPALTGPEAAASLFADDRGWRHLPNAMDVLSNLPFLAIGVWGLRWLHWLDRSPESGPQALDEIPGNTLDCAWLFFAGLIACAAASVFYHLQPDLLRLAADRAGMAVAFAGLIGVAVCERVSQRAGWVAAWTTLAAGLVAVAVWHDTGNVAPWAVVQFGGMVVVLGLALLRPAPGTAGPMGLKLGWIIGFYALAKVFELADGALFEATGHFVSGHSLKHVAAALAALPVLQAVQGLGRHALLHNLRASAVAA